MLNIVGQRFGKLLVQAEAPTLRTPGGYRKRVFSCLCDCGRTVVVHMGNLRSGTSRSCGCVKRIHGGYGTRLYSIWRGVVQRCTVPSYAHYKNYGARGITLCDDWRSFSSFQQWALSSGYADNLTLERKNNDRGYNPSNCVWIPREAQAKNRRTCVRICFEEHEYTATELAQRLGVKYTTLLYRHRNGKPLEK